MLTAHQTKNSRCRHRANMAADMSFPVMQLVNKCRKFGKVKKEFITEEEALRGTKYALDSHKEKKNGLHRIQM
jgi:hypothetical protein